MQTWNRFHADSALDLTTPDVLKKTVFDVFKFVEVRDKEKKSEVMVLDETFQFFSLSNKVLNMSLN